MRVGKQHSRVFNSHRLAGEQSAQPPNVVDRSDLRSRGNLDEQRDSPCRGKSCRTNYWRRRPHTVCALSCGSLNLCK